MLENQAERRRSVDGEDVSSDAGGCSRRPHVNGVDEEPWFEENTFSPQAPAATKFPIMHCYPYWSGVLKYGGPMDPPSTKLLAVNAALIRAYAKDLRKPVWAEEFNIRALKACPRNNTPSGWKSP